MQSEQIYKYVKYLTAHIGRVREAMRRFINTPGAIEDVLAHLGLSEGEKATFIGELTSRADAHDHSKWQIDEFFPYLYHFYPLDGKIPEDGEDPEFDKACELHYQRNDHHDRYWRIEGRNIDQMTLGAEIEMLCDWVSMSVYSDRSPLIWYEENKYDVFAGMSSKKIAWIEYLLYNYFQPIYKELQEEIDKNV